jgi:hypothetical protein
MLTVDVPVPEFTVPYRRMLGDPVIGSPSIDFLHCSRRATCQDAGEGLGRSALDLQFHTRDGSLTDSYNLLTPARATEP